VIKADAVSPNENEWPLREQHLREQEIELQRRSAESQQRSTRLQSVTAIAALTAAFAAVFAAAFAAVKANDALDVAKEGIQRQADENRLTTAINSIGGDTATQRVAGLTLLRRHATQRVENAVDGSPSEVERRDAIRLYRSTVDILVNYLRSGTPTPSQLGNGNPNCHPTSITPPTMCDGGSRTSRCSSNSREMTSRSSRASTYPSPNSMECPGRRSISPGLLQVASPAPTFVMQISPAPSGAQAC